MISQEKHYKEWFLVSNLLFQGSVPSADDCDPPRRSARVICPTRSLRYGDTVHERCNER